MATGERIARETLLPGAILTRVALSHIRVGTFQYFAARRDVEALRVLADHVIDRHYPDVAGARRPYLALLTALIERQAELVAGWQAIGFIHGGVIETSTTRRLIAGETIDYGPCAFMDTFHPDTVFSSIDHGGRYAYGHQPAISQWNMMGFAHTLLPLIDDDETTAVALAQEHVQRFAERFEHFYGAGTQRKLGLAAEKEGDAALVNRLLTVMANDGVDSPSPSAA